MPITYKVQLSCRVAHISWVKQNKKTAKHHHTQKRLAYSNTTKNSLLLIFKGKFHQVKVVVEHSFLLNCIYINTPNYVFFTATMLHVLSSIFFMQQIFHNYFAFFFFPPPSQLTDCFCL